MVSPFAGLLCNYFWRSISHNPSGENEIIVLRTNEAFNCDYDFDKCEFLKNDSPLLVLRFLLWLALNRGTKSSRSEFPYLFLYLLYQRPTLFDLEELPKYIWFLLPIPDLTGTWHTDRYLLSILN